MRKILCVITVLLIFMVAYLLIDINIIKMKYNIAMQNWDNVISIINNEVSKEGADKLTNLYTVYRININLAKANSAYIISMNSLRFNSKNSFEVYQKYKNIFDDTLNDCVYDLDFLRGREIKVRINYIQNQEFDELINSYTAYDFDLDKADDYYNTLVNGKIQFINILNNNKNLNFNKYTYVSGLYTNYSLEKNIILLNELFQKRNIMDKEYSIPNYVSEI